MNTIFDIDNNVSVGFSRNSATTSLSDKTFAANELRYSGKKVSMAARPSWVDQGVTYSGSNVDTLGAGVDVDGKTSIAVDRIGSAEQIIVRKDGQQMNVLTASDLASSLVGTANANLDISTNTVLVCLGTIIFICSYNLGGNELGVYICYSQDYGATLIPLEVVGVTDTDTTKACVPFNQEAAAAGVTGYSGPVTQLWCASLFPVGEYDTLTDFVVTWTDYLGNSNTPKGGQAGMFRLTRKNLNDHLTVRKNRLLYEGWDASLSQQHWHSMGMFNFGKEGIFGVFKGDTSGNATDLLQIDLDDYENSSVSINQNWYGEEGTEDSLSLQPTAIVPMKDGSLLGAADLSYITPRYYAPSTINDNPVVGAADIHYGYNTAGVYFVGRDYLHLRWYPHEDGSVIVGNGGATTLAMAFISVDGENFARLPIGGDFTPSERLMLAGRELHTVDSGTIYRAELPSVYTQTPLELYPGGSNLVTDPETFDENDSTTFNAQNRWVVSRPSTQNSLRQVYHDGDDWRYSTDDTLCAEQTMPARSGLIMRFERPASSTSNDGGEPRLAELSTYDAGQQCLDMDIFNAGTGKLELTLTHRTLQGGFSTIRSNYVRVDQNNDWWRLVSSANSAARTDAALTCQVQIDNPGSVFFICFKTWSGSEFAIGRCEGESSSQPDLLSVPVSISGDEWTVSGSCRWPDSVSFREIDHPLFTYIINSDTNLVINHDPANDNTDVIVTVDGSVAATLTCDTDRMNFGGYLNWVISYDGTNISATLSTENGFEYATAAVGSIGSPVSLINGNADRSTIVPIELMGLDYSSESKSQSEQLSVIRDMSFLQDSTVNLSGTINLGKGYGIISIEDLKD